MYRNLKDTFHSLVYEINEYNIKRKKKCFDKENYIVTSNYFCTVGFYLVTVKLQLIIRYANFNLVPHKIPKTLGI